MLETNICSAIGCQHRSDAGGKGPKVMPQLPGELEHQNGATYLPPDGERPYYQPVGNEETVFKAPTGKGFRWC